MNVRGLVWVKWAIFGAKSNRLDMASKGMGILESFSSVGNVFPFGMKYIRKACSQSIGDIDCFPPQTLQTGSELWRARGFPDCRNFCSRYFHPGSIEHFRSFPKLIEPVLQDGNFRISWCEIQFDPSRWVITGPRAATSRCRFGWWIFLTGNPHFFECSSEISQSKENYFLKAWFAFQLRESVFWDFEILLWGWLGCEWYFWRYRFNKPSCFTFNFRRQTNKRRPKHGENGGTFFLRFQMT